MQGVVVKSAQRLVCSAQIRIKNGKVGRERMLDGAKSDSTENEMKESWAMSGHCMESYVHIKRESWESGTGSFQGFDCVRGYAQRRGC